MNKIFFYLPIIQMLSWLFPIFRQYKSKYFAFFLFLGISDVVILLLYLFKINPQPFYPPINIIILSSLIFKKYDFKNIFITFVFSLIIYLLCLGISETYGLYVGIPFVLTMILLWIKEFVLNIQKTHNINVFFINIILFLSVTFFGLVYGLGGGVLGSLYFILNNVFSTLMAIYFTIFTEETSKVFKLKLEA